MNINAEHKRNCAWCGRPIRGPCQDCTGFDGENGLVCWTGEGPFTNLLPDIWGLGAVVTVTWQPTRTDARQQHAIGELTELEPEPPGLTIDQRPEYVPRDEPRELYVDIDALTVHSITPAQRQRLGDIKRIDLKALPDQDPDGILGTVYAYAQGDINVDGPFVWPDPEYYQEADSA